MDDSTPVVLFDLAILVIFGIPLFGISLRRDKNRRMQEEVSRHGTEIDVEILERFEAGAPAGSELAKARQTAMASWDLLELELRYVFQGQEIISRGQVSVETFFHTRSMKTLKIRVSPDRPEEWAALTSPR